MRDRATTTTEGHHADQPCRPPERIEIVDALRGLALIGMTAFHLRWDLHAFGFADTDPSGAAEWRILGQGVASTFLVLSGCGLSLAYRHGASTIRIVRRLLTIAASADLVTVATSIAMPGATVWFGILHCIVITNLVALALRRSSAAVLIACGVASIVAPTMIGGTLSEPWAWIGLSAREPATLDFRPVLPWLGPVLFGSVVGRMMPLRQMTPGWLPARPMRALATLGRHALTFYLLHQPVLVLIVMSIAALSVDKPSQTPLLDRPDEAAAFMKACRQTCSDARTLDGEVCKARCDCAMTAIIGKSRGPGGITTWPWAPGPALVSRDALLSCGEQR